MWPALCWFKFRNPFSVNLAIVFLLMNCGGSFVVSLPIKSQVASFEKNIVIGCLWRCDEFFLFCCNSTGIVFVCGEDQRYWLIQFTRNYTWQRKTATASLYFVVRPCSTRCTFNLQVLISRYNSKSLSVSFHSLRHCIYIKNLLFSRIYYGRELVCDYSVTSPRWFYRGRYFLVLNFPVGNLSCSQHWSVNSREKSPRIFITSGDNMQWDGDVDVKTQGLCPVLRWKAERKWSWNRSRERILHIYFRHFDHKSRSRNWSSPQN